MSRWFDISVDPNDPGVQQWRRNQISAARAGELVDDRVGYLCSLAAGKQVLDVGVVEHFVDASEGSQWLHGALCKVARRCLGVDVLEKELAILRQRGYLVQCLDLTKEVLSEQFDLIVVGEVIEHLDAPGLFLRNLARMLKPDGRCVLTTPNPWFINPIIKNLFRASTFVDSVDHTAWFDPSSICELAERADLRLVKFSGVSVGSGAKSRAARALFRPIKAYSAIGFRADLFAKTIIYELVRQDSKACES
jgi:SAM-dependent methyltransferase